jgi:hypothetical protein
VCQRVHLHGAPPQLCEPPLIALQRVAPHLAQLLAAAAQAVAAARQALHAREWSACEQAGMHAHSAG